MLPVSEAFHTAARATVRHWRPRLEITWTDPFIDTTITVSSNDTNRVAWLYQVADLKTTTTRKWAHLDGVIVPDGTYFPMPGTLVESYEAQMGWYGATPCDGEGWWSEPYPTLTVEFAARPVLAFVVVGDSVYDEHPVCFDIYAYNSFGDAVYHTDVENNGSNSWSLDVSAEGLNDIVKIELVVKSWSVPDRVVKITEFYTSVVETYEGDEVVGLSLLEEKEISTGSLPIGNISANELDFELQNIAIMRGSEKILDPFFPMNTNSPFHSLMKKNRRVRAELGLRLASGEYEYVALGTYWTGDWNVPETSGTVTTSARDRMELLNKLHFTSSELYVDKTLYELLEIVLEDARDVHGMLDLRWTIDGTLRGYTVPYAWFDDVTHFQAVKDIVTACLGTAYMSRDDVLVIQDFHTSTIGEAYEITDDDYFTKNQPAKSDQLRNVIVVNTQPLAPALAADEVYRSEEVQPIDPGQTITVEAKYSDAPVVEGSVTPIVDPEWSPLFVDSDILPEDSDFVVEDLSITAVTFYSWGASVSVRNNGVWAGNFGIAIMGKTLNVDGTEKITESDAISIREYGEQFYSFPDNPYVQTRVLATRIAQTLLASFKDVSRDVSTEWRGDPSLELGDPVTVPEYVKHGIGSVGIFRETKSKLTFDGTLRVTTDARKVDERVRIIETGSAPYIIEESGEQATIYVEGVS